MKIFFNGTWKLTKFTFRKERIATVIWLIILFWMSVGVAAAFTGLFPDSDPEALAGYAQFFDNPAMIAMLGKLYGDLSTETLYVGSMIVYVALAVGIMNIFLVIRNTRGEEEKGRYEVIRSLPAGRLSSLGAVLIVAAAVNLVLSVICGIGIWACGYALGGSILFGFAVGITGMFFAALAALLAQLCANSKNAIGLSIIFIGLFYIIRGIGDMDAEFEALSYISPFGLILRSEAYAGNYWWPVLVLFGLSCILIASAFYFNAVRDLGRGLIPEKPGRAEGSFLMKTPEGFLWKLLRGGIFAWTAGMMLFAAMYGAIMGEIESFIAGNEFIAQLLVPPPGHTQSEMFIGLVTVILALLCSVPPLLIMLKLAGEEKLHRYENILSKRVSRQRIMTAHLIYACGQAFLTLFAASLGFWAAAAAAMADPISFSAVFSSYMVYLPAVLLMIGIACLLAGAMPKRATVVTMAFIGITFFTLYLAPMLNLPEEIKYITPYGYIPQLPMDTVNFWVLAVLTAAAAGAAVGGYFTYRRRDLL